MKGLVGLSKCKWITCPRLLHVDHVTPPGSNLHPETDALTTWPPRLTNRPLILIRFSSSIHPHPFIHSSVHPHPLIHSSSSNNPHPLIHLSAHPFIRSFFFVHPSMCYRSSFIHYSRSPNSTRAIWMLISSHPHPALPHPKVIKRMTHSVLSQSRYGSQTGNI